ncbi:MAG: hypothetical protein VW551_00190 [Euryarchaeota archaeon]|jgi:hypothetical protein
MILRELFYFDPETVEPTQNDRYEPQHDESPLKASDTRKTRLTLKQINRIRKASDLHKEEQVNDLDFIRQMYGVAANAEAGV